VTAAGVESPWAGGARFDLTVGVASDVPHWAMADGRVWAYEPYVREMAIWARLFARVEVCAPAAEGPLRGNQAPYPAPNVRWRPVPYSQVQGAGGMARRILRVPRLAGALYDLVRTSDLVLLRSPGHAALVGRVIATALGAPTITKWASFFGPMQREGVPRRLERLMVERIRRPALVYGPSRRPHLISFIPALMTDGELRQARARGARRRWAPPWKILTVGQLLPGKGFDLAVEGLGRLHATAPDLPWTAFVIGDGPQRGALHEMAARAGIADRVTFTGALSFDAVQEHYADAHVVIMPGTREGWPKTIPEAWAHGAVSVAAAAGIVPWMMEGKHAGLTFAPTPDALGEVLRTALSDPAAMQAMGGRGQHLVADLSLEVFATRLERALCEHCGLA